MTGVLEPALSEAVRVEEDDDAYWAAVHEVQKHEPREVWRAIQPLATSPDQRLRQLVPDVLRYLGAEARPLVEDTVVLLRRMLSEERSPLVLGAIAAAFIDLKHSSVVELLVPLTHHEDAEVRRMAVHGLLQASVEVIPRLVQLAVDPDGEVRNWVLFTLGLLAQEEAYVPAVREALASAITDARDEARAEAILGLARCHDVRAVEPTRLALLGKARWDHYKEAAQLLIDAGLGAEELRAALLT